MTVFGGASDDSLDAGNGVDHLDGGDSTDTCSRSGAQVCMDCETAGAA